MNRPRAFVTVSIVLAGIAACGAAFAQAPVPTPSPAPSATTSSRPSATSQIETWTRKQWDLAQKEWAKDKAKWADCRKQAKAKKLSGRKSWSFLYQCMTG